MDKQDKTQETAGAIITQIAGKRREKQAARFANKNAVVRFKKRNAATGRKYTYVALYAGGRWWTTALGQEGRVASVRSIYSHEQFLDLMTSPDVSKIEVATAWAPVQ
jgi:hypothetical protein